MYSNGGWIAKAGSCKIGLNPKPFSGIGIILSKGLEVIIVNNTKPIVINAWVSKVLESKEDLVLNIIGKSADKIFYEELQILVSDLNLQDKVNFLGFSQDLKLDFQKSDIILSFSEHESTHLTLFEGLSCGAWPLSRNWDGVDEFLPSDNIFTNDSDFVKKVLSFYNSPESDTTSKLDELSKEVLPKFSNPDPRQIMVDCVSNLYKSRAKDKA